MDGLLVLLAIARVEMDGRMAGRREGRRTNGRTNGRTDADTYAGMDGQTDGRPDEQTADERKQTTKTKKHWLVSNTMVEELDAKYD